MKNALHVRRFPVSSRRWLCAYLALCAGLSAAMTPQAQAQASDYPNRTVRIINPFLPGAANDILARLLATKLGERWGRSVIVENKVGAAGVIGLNFVAKSAADGYTFVVAANTLSMMIPALHPNLPFDVRKDFAPVIYIADVPTVVTVNAGTPFKTVQDLVSYAKANPGKLTFGSSGTGSSLHMIGEYFNSLVGIELLHVPYKGAPESLNATISGEVDLSFGAASSVAPQVRSGKVKVLLASGSKPVSVLPDVPVAASVGMPEFDVPLWYGIFAPAGTPAAAIQRFYRDAAEILNEPETREQLVRMGFNVVAGSPEQLGELVTSDLARWTRLVRDRGITAK
ncbi:MAG: Bug family tripartite tricarboxylate transporter substrate binding protein [Lautropia sp.]